MCVIRIGNLRGTEEEIQTLKQSSQALSEVCNRDISSHGSCYCAFIADLQQLFEPEKWCEVWKIVVSENSVKSPKNIDWVSVVLTLIMFWREWC